MSSLTASEPAIQIRGMGKSFEIRHNDSASSTLAESAMRRLRRPLARQSRENYEALRDITVDIPAGQVTGVIGRNGAGKSTLLKVLSRVTPPSAGRVLLRGRVGSLLEVGTGFHPELTGRENIYLNGAVLGMRKREVGRKFDEIVAFADVERFLDTPVKRYSSGMYVRLAFAVAASLDTEILLIDEVLAVGDQQFQDRCIRTMREAAASGRTVVFVSHQMHSVATLCHRAIVLEQGRLIHDGDVQSGIELYSARADSGEITEFEARPGSGQHRLAAISGPAKALIPGEPLNVDFEIARKAADRTPFFVSMHIVEAKGTTLVQCDSRLVEHTYSGDDERVRGHLEVRTPMLRPGSYTVDVFVCATGVGILDEVEAALRFSVAPVLPYAGVAGEDAYSRGMVLADFEFRDAPSEP